MAPLCNMAAFDMALLQILLKYCVPNDALDFILTKCLNESVVQYNSTVCASLFFNDL